MCLTWEKNTVTDKFSWPTKEKQAIIGTDTCFQEDCVKICFLNKVKFKWNFENVQYRVEHCKYLIGKTKCA